MSYSMSLRYGCGILRSVAQLHLVQAVCIEWEELWDTEKRRSTTLSRRPTPTKTVLWDTEKRRSTTLEQSPTPENSGS